MKFSRERFSVPDCVFEDGLPYAALCLLVYLFSQSSVAGHCAPGYDAMMHALHTRCRNTINRNLRLLQKRGWFHYSKRRGNQNKSMWLCIPPRYAPKKTAHTSVIEEMNPRYGRIG